MLVICFRLLAVAVVDMVTVFVGAFPSLLSLLLILLLLLLLLLLLFFVTIAVVIVVVHCNVSFLVVSATTTVMLLLWLHGQVDVWARDGVGACAVDVATATLAELQRATTTADSEFAAALQRLQELSVVVPPQLASSLLLFNGTPAEPMRSTVAALERAWTVTGVSCTSLLRPHSDVHGALVVVLCACWIRVASLLPVVADVNLCCDCSMAHSRLAAVPAHPDLRWRAVPNPGANIPTGVSW
jgi:hypothetical protein